VKVTARILGLARPRLPARLKLDFAPRAHRAPALGWVLFGAGAVAATFAAVQLQLAHASRSRAAVTLTELNAALDQYRSGDGRPAKQADPRDVRRAQAAAKVARELQTPWSDLLATFEAVAGRDVALLVVEPSAAQQTVRITAEARNPAAMFDYLDALRARSFAQVHLVSHQVQAQTPGTPIRFQALARWGQR
jgi:hypothetical protein